MMTEDELIEVYGVTEMEGRRQLMRGVEMAKEESEGHDTDSSVSTRQANLLLCHIIFFH
jgi:hypothetical protein